MCFFYLWWFALFFVLQKNISVGFVYLCGTFSFYFRFRVHVFLVYMRSGVMRVCNQYSLGKEEKKPLD